MDWVYQGNQSETTDWVSFWDDLYEQLNEAFVTTDPGFAVTPVHGSAPLKGTDVYAGTYSNDYVGIVQVKGTDNQNLTMEIGGRSLLLTHWDRDVFIMRPVAEHPEHPTTVTFSVGPGGQAQQVLID
ncbi:hypothetical protein LTR41_012226, partial [Exophiala xenobiotica]